MRMVRIQALCALVLGAACSRERGSVTAVECPVDPVPLLSIGTDQGAPEYELHRVFGSTRLSDGRIVLVNQGTQELRYYDAAGRFLQGAGRGGRGPGEFSDAFLIWPMPGDTVWVGNYDPWQFHVFGPDGKWVRTVDPRPQYLNSPSVIAVLDDGRMILAPDRHRDGRSGAFVLSELTLVVHRPDGMLSDTIGNYPNGHWGQVEPGPGAVWMYPLFESFAGVAARGSQVVVGHGDSPVLTVFEGRDTLQQTRVIRWDAGHRGVDPADVATERDRIAKDYSDVDEATRRQLIDPLISEDRPVAERFPAFTGVELGRDGRVWVRQFRRPSAPAGERWIVFDESGVACRVAMPPSYEIHEFGADYALGLDRDSLGVERVRMYRIGPPAPR